MGTKPVEQIKFKGSYIDGRFSLPKEESGSWKGVSPADLDDHIGTISYSHSQVDEAVACANEAFHSWRKTPIENRIHYFDKLKSSILKREKIISQTLSREIGKPLWESLGEFKALNNKIDITIKEGLKLIEDKKIEDLGEGTVGFCRYKPLGVLAVVGPFNFPIHLPNGHITPALLTGNTVVFKPSEKAPLVGQLIAECFDEAGFPKGVFNLVQGERELSRRLSTHSDVHGVLFTGSYEVGLRIKQDTLQQHWKLLALEMGGKNSAIVWKDARLDVALHDTLFGAFVTSGQRCSSTSKIIIHKDVFDEFLEKFHLRSKSFEIGHPFENPFMGPVIDSSIMDRYVKFQGIAIREGAEVVMRGKALDVEGYVGHYVSPSICLAKSTSLEDVRKSIYLQTELFSPNVAFLVVDDIDHAVALANETQYGLVTSIFTQDSKIYQKCLEDLRSGLVNWNKPTVGATSRLPFGGMGKSGNHFPTASAAPKYCTYPTSSMETAQPKLGKKFSPGLNWEI